ncbi:MAG: hypothetical protein COU07_04085 [Candidatus Harrisonbacteria bacterium CG10_big_fil_rev_8_21_14_0_10_40_38]|uniref:Serine protease n=1 Tax=Candidatus Harrisonbacteria bacterium CG10_big_fil_rev_8_21_14_0_10_40_38 TaxID=1974583 RepID=A0A2H0UR35_9BACT|nr:MAG: hypothetical protein COU07_04085 [Candidatus Harrisonbacteria bacterium CG10_big_fil_rev_8_21_14_0_10_40_38]
MKTKDNKMAVSCRFVLFPILALCFLILTSCKPPQEEKNTFRREGRFKGGLNVPVAFLVNELAGQPRILASGWLIEGSEGILFSAKHFTDDFMGKTIELGKGECKAFIKNMVFNCSVLRVPPIRDAVVLELRGPQAYLDLLPKPYQISYEKINYGDTLVIQGLHPHPLFISELNESEGFKDYSIPILRDYYEARMADPAQQMEVVFDGRLKGIVVKPDPAAVLRNPLLSDEGKKAMLQYENDSYLKVIIDRDHKFSFGGLSGGVALKNGKAVGVITAQDPFRFELDKKGFLFVPGQGRVFNIKAQHFDVIYITPIGSVKELAEYGKRVK